MAGETSIVRRGPEIPDRSASVVDALPLRWLLRSWSALLALELIGAGATLASRAALVPQLAALATAGMVIVLGGPLFLLTWLRLAAHASCPHGRLLLLVGSWVAALVTTHTIPDQRAAIVLVTLGLPIASTLEMLRAILRVERSAADAVLASRLTEVRGARGAT